MRHVLFLLLVTACASHIKTEVVGTGMAAIQPRGVANNAAPAGVQLARGTYDFALHFDLSRAEVIDYTVTCPGAEQHGSIGETFDAYRQRRLAQLRAERSQDRRNAAAVTSLVVGAVTPTVQARAQTPTASVDATVPGQAVGVAAGSAVADSMQDIVELTPGDVGAGRLQTRVHIATTADGVCVVTANADDTHLAASFQITRVRDLDAEARERATAANGHAQAVRGALTAQLVGYGADPAARQRQREAEARARAEAQARLQAKRDEQARVAAQLHAEAEARLQIRLAAEAQLRADAEARLRVKLAAEAQLRADAEAQLRADAEARLQAKRAAEYAIVMQRRELALQVRVSLTAYLVRCGADPGHLARLRAEAQATREAREAQLAREREARDAERRARDAQLALKLEAQRAREAEIAARRDRERAARAAAVARRTELALGVRAELRAYLVRLGAHERPPMPAPLPEAPGSSPFAGAEWIAGHWSWTGAQWHWEVGGWRDTTVFGATGVEAAVTAAGGGPAVSIDATLVTPVVVDRDHRTEPTSRDHRTGTEPTSRDHRTGATEPTTSPSTTRDHRTGATEPTTSQPSTTRDHRTGATESTVRDHRKHDATDDSTVRDHRR